MKKPAIILVVLIIFLGGGFWLAKNKILFWQTPTTGYLEGYMKIVNQCIPDNGKNIRCLVSQEIYAQRKLEIYAKETTTLIKEVSLDDQGHYRVVLPAGQYTAELNRVGPGWSADLPRNFLIEAGQTRYVNLNLVVK